MLPVAEINSPTSPQLAFVVPAFNEEALIGGCIEAIVKQIAKGNHPAEVVVVNNASTDRTGEIARSFPGVTVVDEPKKGLVNARHAGLNASSAELVANVDADTLLPDGWIEAVLKHFESDDTLVALSGPFIYYDLSMASRAWVRVFYYAAYLIYALNRFVFRTGSMLQGGNFVFRRSSWVSVGGFDRSIAFYGEDTDVARRLSKVGRVRWTFDLPMLASGRRLQEEGVIVTGLRYTLNYFWVTVMGKPFTKKYNDIRPDAE